MEALKGDKSGMVWDAADFEAMEHRFQEVLGIAGPSPPLHLFALHSRADIWQGSTSEPGRDSNFLPLAVISTQLELLTAGATSNAAGPRTGALRCGVWEACKGGASDARCVCPIAQSVAYAGYVVPGGDTASVHRSALCFCTLVLQSPDMKSCVNELRLSSC